MLRHVRLVLFPLALALTVPPLVDAHVEGGLTGTTKEYCERLTGDAGVHDYGMVGWSPAKADWDHPRVASWSPEHRFVLAEPTVGVWPNIHHPEWTAVYAGMAVRPAEGNIQDCDGDGVFPDHDLHYEFATSGAFLFAQGTSPHADSGGSDACWGVYPDHNAFPLVRVVDVALPAVRFVVAADTLEWWTYPYHEGCGDMEVDDWVECIDFCWIPFGPGRDGSYVVFIEGTIGHVYAS